MHRRTPIALASLASIVLAVAVASAPSARAEAPSRSGASAAIDALHEGLLGVMKQADAIGYRGRYDRLYAIVTQSFDLPFMAEKTVGRHWSKLSPEEQQQWLASFHEMTAATYAGRFEGFSGQTFEVLGEEPAGHGTTVVRSVLHNPSGEDVQLNYRLHETGGAWRVIDVYLNGTVSELALRRSEYSAVLKRDGFAKLIETIEGKTQELATGSLN
ncbi:MAG: ABC transporter substrate-binding protein [Myxococcales bacterium]|nr:ABC transporter substrate-binding protein [Myxococcales bacterium]